MKYIIAIAAFFGCVLGADFSKTTEQTELRLSGEQLGDAGLLDLKEGIVGNRALKSLHLNNNQLTDKSVPILCEIIKKNQTLEYVALILNDFSHKESQRFLEALEKSNVWEFVLYERGSHLWAKADVILRKNRAKKAL